LLLIISCTPNPNKNISIQKIRESTALYSEIQRKEEDRFTYLPRKFLINEIDQDLSDKYKQVEIRTLPKYGRLIYIPPKLSLNKIEIWRKGRILRTCSVNSTIIMDSNDCLDKNKKIFQISSFKNTCGTDGIEWPQIICNLNFELIPNDEIIAIDNYYDNNNSIYKIQALNK
jgi:hypothetical protein